MKYNVIMFVFMMHNLTVLYEGHDDS